MISLYFWLNNVDFRPEFNGRNLELLPGNAMNKYKYYLISDGT